MEDEIKIGDKAYMFMYGPESTGTVVEVTKEKLVKIKLDKPIEYLVSYSNRIEKIDK